MRKPALFFDVGVRIDLEEAQRVLAPEQITAVMVGIGKVLSVNRDVQESQCRAEASEPERADGVL